MSRWLGGSGGLDATPSGTRYSELDSFRPPKTQVREGITHELAMWNRETEREPVTATVFDRIKETILGGDEPETDDEREDDRAPQGPPA